MQFNNDNVENKHSHVPAHLVEHIAEQNYDLYTAMDHASWRYIMRVSAAFFKQHAHPKYISGLEQTGITIDRIPRIEEMDEKLRKFGWRAVTVTGFIPPAVFLEFQSLSILPIACDMRRLEHLEYTPSPDIVHEAAGHAPIISDPDYASYLHKFGEIARKAIFAKEDLEVYQAIKYLSDIKEEPHTTEDEIKLAYERLHLAESKVKYVSEAAQLSRLGWWSIEYGLVKIGDEFKIYGAGLLSSVSESYNSVHGEVKKIPLTVNCIDVDYDITKPQPQLFYVESFLQLEKVIDELANRMAYRKGNKAGLEVAKKAGTVTTAVLDSGLQVSGVLSNFLMDATSEPCYLQFAGPTQLACNDLELPGHSAQYHAQGFGSPLGLVKGLNKPASALTLEDLERLGFKFGQKGTLEFTSGVQLIGEFLSRVYQSSSGEIRHDKDGALKAQGNAINLILTFKDCKVTMGDQLLFDPSWGLFDMACGVNVTSSYGGAADRARYLNSIGELKASPKAQFSNLTIENRELNELYKMIRTARESQIIDLEVLQDVHCSLTQNHPADWLLRVELLELLDLLKRTNKNSTELDLIAKLKFKIEQELNIIADKSQVHAKLIKRGIELLN